ncbi:MAG: putative ABC transporter permease [Clostridia bacterium]|nr:putative ABC transporter permease [Clostridia bacterium]
MDKKQYTKVNQYILLFLLISFVGWVMETAFCSFLYKTYCDRGFLTLPFCTIYGFSILIIYFLLGTPQEGGLLLAKCKNKVLRLILYFSLAVVIPTVAELITGAFFDRVLGVTLWDYSMYKYNLWGYICLEFSLLWGVLITAAMAFVFPLMKKAIEKIPDRIATILATVLAVAVLIDWTLCFINV